MALLELDGLTRRFGGIVAVDGVTMRVAAGEVRAVIGPNGAGKSTLFNLITGVVNRDIRRASLRRRDADWAVAYRICQRGISRTFQITALFPEMTARENARLRRRRGMRGAGSRTAAVPCSRDAERAAMRRWNGWA